MTLARHIFYSMKFLLIPYHYLRLTLFGADMVYHLINLIHNGTVSIYTLFFFLTYYKIYKTYNLKYNEFIKIYFLMNPMIDALYTSHILIFCLIFQRCPNSQITYVLFVFLVRLFVMSMIASFFSINEKSQFCSVPAQKEFLCSICLDETDSNIIQLTCKHCYHLNCIKEWIEKCYTLRIPSTCPICRKLIEYRQSIYLLIESPFWVS